MSLKQKQIKHLKNRINELDKTISQARLKKRINENARTLSIILENELEQAEIILAIKDLSNRLQKMAETVARMNAEDVLPMVDQIREIFGPKKSDDFSKAATEGLNVIMQAVKHAKEMLGNQILNLENKPFEAEPGDSNDNERTEHTVDDDSLTNNEKLKKKEDEFGAADAAAGPDKEPLGREMKKEGLQPTKKAFETKGLRVGENVSFVDSKGRQRSGKIVEKHSNQSNVVNTKEKQGTVHKSSIKNTKESTDQKKNLSKTADVNNNFLNNVQKTQALGEKFNTKFDVNGKEYTIQDLQRECQYYDQEKLEKHGTALASKYQAFADLVKNLQQKGVNNAVVLAAFLGRKKFGPQFFEDPVVYEYKNVMEKAPPGVKAERFIKQNKEKFKKRYGKNWERILYATAWKMFGEHADFASKAKKLIEQYDPLWDWSDSIEEKQMGKKLQNEIKEVLTICPSWQMNDIKNHWSMWLKHTLNLDATKYPMPEVKENENK